MRIVFFGNGNRGVACLRQLIQAGHDIVACVVHPRKGDQWYGSVADEADAIGVPVMDPDDPNTEQLAGRLLALQADVFVLAGYGKIIKPIIIDIPRLMTVNLHSGKLPKYRGSSPMNWALINGDTQFTITVIQVDQGVDTGPVLLERTFPIGPDDTIRELHAIANDHFPLMLAEVVAMLDKGDCPRIPQPVDGASYYPLRFPDDGLVLWDTLSADQIHNRIRALTKPYPCAFTYVDDRRVQLIASRTRSFNFFGEPGRIYRKTDDALLVCAKDKCLWITEAVFADTQESIFPSVDRYACFATMQRAAMALYESRNQSC